VLTYESATLHQSRQMSQTLTAAGYPAAKMQYLVNRSDSTGGLPRSVIEELIGRKPDFEVVSDGLLVVEANNRGEPFIKLGPDAPITRDVAKIAKQLTSETPSAKAADRKASQPQSAASAGQ